MTPEFVDSSTVALGAAACLTGFVAIATLVILASLIGMVQTGWQQQRTRLDKSRIAVIAAAVAVMLDEPHVLKSVRLSEGNELSWDDMHSAWSLEGRRQIFASKIR